MSVFNTNCPHCNGELEVQDEYVGMTLECPLCQREFVLQKKEAVPTEKTCPLCGKMINIKATRCKFCKKDITQLPTPLWRSFFENMVQGRQKRVLFLILGVLLVILIAGGLFFVKYTPDMIPSRQAVAQLRFNNSEYQTNIAVRKKINLNNSCSILVYPVERKEHAQNISNKIAGIRDSFNQYKHHFNEAKRFNQLASNVNITGIDSYQQSSSYSDKALEHVNKAKSSLNQAKNYHEEVKALMLNDVLASMKDIGKKEYDLASFQMKNNSCDISNINGPVILLAVETINYGDGFESYQAWYMEYTPFDETTWELR